MAGTSKHAARSAIKHGSDALKDLPEEVTDAVKQLATEVRDQTLGLVQAGREQIGEYGEHVEETIRSNPVRAVLIGIGVGFVIGLLVGRR